MTAPNPIEISKAQAANFLVGHLGLRSFLQADAAISAKGILDRLRCVQLDPLDRIGTNADLVAHARSTTLKRGGIYAELLPGAAFEHFAKERCLLPTSSFPRYRDHLCHRARFRWDGVLEPVPPSLVDEVVAEISQRGPSMPSQLEDRGRIEPLTGKRAVRSQPANSVAVELAWLRCRLVVSGRAPSGKVYDLPERALPDLSATDHEDDVDRWALLTRAEACGLLPTVSGPQWGLIGETRNSALQELLVATGELLLVQVDGLSRKYLAPGDFLDRKYPADDGEMRVIAPLDPLLWDRKLVQHVFGFDYVWEVYKPAKKRKWGYYVCPLLQDARLVGRFEARRVDGRVDVETLWIESGQDFDESAWDRARQRLEEFQ